MRKICRFRSCVGSVTRIVIHVLSLPQVLSTCLIETIHEAHPSPFKWRHYAPELILLCVRWYCRYQLSYRDVEEMMRERGLNVDHSTVFRWVQRYAPEINKRVRPYLEMSGTSYRVDETYNESRPQQAAGYQNKLSCSR
jgi:transposase-like protein